MIKCYVLSNGTRVFVETVDHTATVSVGYWILWGSRDEKKNERGFSHLLEHMLFKGTLRRSAYDIARDIDRVGGVLNAFTEKELVCYYCTLPYEHLGLAIDVITDMVYHASIDEQELTKEKQIVINEIKSADDLPEEKAHEKYLRDLWNTHPLAAKITGEEEDVLKIERTQLYSFYREKYIPANMIISVSGRLEPEDVISKLEKGIDSSERATAGLQREVPARAFNRNIVRERCNQTHIYMGLMFSPQADIREYYGTLAMSTVFGESMSSRLFQQLRENHGYCYTAYSFRNYYSDVGQWTIYASTVPQLVEKTLIAINGEFERMSTQPPNDGELMDAKSHLKGGLVLVKEDMETRMKRLVRQYLLIGEVFDFDRSLELLESITLEDIEHTVSTLIEHKRFNLLVYGGSNLRTLKRIKLDY